MKEKISLYFENDYLSENKEIKEAFFNIANEEGINLFIAETGGGKTYLVSKTFEELSKKEPNRLFIIACPNKIQNEQNQISYNLKALVGGNGKKIEDIQSNTISMVYDKAEELIEYIQSNNLKTTLVIDEAHQLIYSKSFRGKAINNLNQLQKVCFNVIHITATPRTNIEIFNYNKIIECKPKNKIHKIEELTIAQGEKSLVEKEIIHIMKQEINKNKKILLFIDDKNKIKEFNKNHLEAEIKNAKIETLDSDKKESDLFKNIINNSTIPNDIDIVISTSVLECGTNIKNKDITTIYYLNNNSYLCLDKIIQSLARARKYQDNAYIFLKMPNKKDDDENNKYFNEIDTIIENQNNFNKSRKETSQYFYDKIKSNEFYENEAENEIISILNSKDIKNNKLKKCLYFDEESETILIDEIELIKTSFNIHDIQYIHNIELLARDLKDSLKAKYIKIIRLGESDKIHNYDKREEKAKEKKQQEKETLKIKEKEAISILKEGFEELHNYNYQASINEKENKKEIDRLKKEATEKENKALNIIENHFKNINLDDLNSINDNNLNNDISLNFVNAFIDKIEKNKEIQEEINKIYKKCKKEADRYKNNEDYYLTFKESIIAKAYKKDLEALLFSKYNNLNWSKDKDVISKLSKEGQKYAIIRNYLDKKIGNRVNNNLIKKLYWELNPKKKQQKKEPSKITIDRLKKNIKTIYRINNDNKISSLK